MGLFAASNNDALVIFVFVMVAIGIVIFNVWKIVCRPDVYKAELEDRRHAREQRAKVAAPVAGGLFKLLCIILGGGRR